MTRLPDLLRRLPALVGALALTALLAACTITSKDLLVSDDEAVTPLPANLHLFSYRQADPNSDYTLADGPPASMALNGKAYVADDGSLAARFVPLDAADTYLIAATGKDSTVYGLAHYRAPFLTLKMVLDTPIRDEFTAAALPGVTVNGEDGILVSDRAALDASIALIRSSKTEIGTLVMFVADGKDATAPATIVPDGDSFKPGS